MKFERNKLNPNFYRKGGGQKFFKSFYKKLQITYHIDKIFMR